MIFPRSGFLADVSSQYFGDVTVAFTFVVEPDLDKYRDEDYTNPYWRRNLDFQNTINQRGQAFIDSLNQTALIERLNSVDRIVQKATKPQKSRYGLTQGRLL